MAFIALCPIKATTVWHSGYTVQLNLGQAFNTRLSLSGFMRKIRKLESLQACCQMQAKLSLNKYYRSWLQISWGNGYCEDSTVGEIGLFFNIHHSDNIPEHLQRLKKKGVVDIDEIPLTSNI